MDGKSYGNCVVFPNGDYNCNVITLAIQGRRKFRCLTVYTADDLKVNAKVASTLDAVVADIEEEKRDLTALEFKA